MIDYGYAYLVSCAVHVGHSLSNSNRYCAWMVVARRENTLLINLYKFSYMMRLGIDLMQHSSKMGFPVWFISLYPLVENIVKSAALSSGEFFVVKKWIFGMLSNYRKITLRSYAKYLSLHESVRSRRYQALEEVYGNWHLTRFSWPRLVFVTGLKHTYKPVKEALSARILTIGICDTDAYIHSMVVPIPGNDSSSFTIAFYNNLISSVILRRKFSNVVMWYKFIRGSPQLLSFTHWFKRMSEEGVFSFEKLLRTTPQKPTWSPLFHEFSRVSEFLTRTTNLLFSRSEASLITLGSFSSLDVPHLEMTDWTIKDRWEESLSVEKSVIIALLKIRFFSFTQDKLFRKEFTSEMSLRKEQRPLTFSSLGLPFRYNSLNIFSSSGQYMMGRATSAQDTFLLWKREQPFFWKLLRRLYSSMLLLSLLYSHGLNRPVSFVTPYTRHNLRGARRFRNVLMKQKLPPRVPRFFNRIGYIFIARLLGLGSSFMAPGMLFPSSYILSTPSRRDKYEGLFRYHVLWNYLKQGRVKAKLTQEILWRRNSPIENFLFFRLGGFLFSGLLPRSHWFWETHLSPLESKYREIKQTFSSLLSKTRSWLELSRSFPRPPELEEIDKELTAEQIESKLWEPSLVHFLPRIMRQRLLFTIRHKKAKPLDPRWDQFPHRIARQHLMDQVKRQGLRRKVVYPFSLERKIVQRRWRNRRRLPGERGPSQGTSAPGLPWKKDRPSKPQEGSHRWKKDRPSKPQGGGHRWKKDTDPVSPESAKRVEKFWFSITKKPPST